MPRFLRVAPDRIINIDDVTVAVITNNELDIALVNGTSVKLADRAAIAAWHLLLDGVVYDVSQPGDDAAKLLGDLPVSTEAD